MTSKPSIAELIAQATGETVSNSDTPSVTLINTDAIDMSDLNFYTVAEVGDLASSIELNGLLEPVTVTPAEGGRYRLISGHRRLTAWLQIQAEAKDAARWAKIPAFVRPVADRLREELMLIQANSANRVLTPAEISKQAERLTALFVELKGQGVEFPGRMRDAVAEAMKVSASKLARLHKIRSSLDARLLRKFDDGTLCESTAYVLAQRPQDIQALFVNERPADLTASTADDLANYAEACSKLGVNKCKADPSQTCSYGMGLYKTGTSQKYSWNRCGLYGKTCCIDCSSAEKCKSVCPVGKPEIDRRAARREAAEQKAKKQDKKTREAARLAADESWARLRKLREAAGIGVKDRRLSSLIYDYPAYEARTTDSTSDAVSAIYVAARAVKMADLFGCSVDTLLGHEANSELRPAGDRWHDAKAGEMPEGDAYGELLVFGNGRAKCVPAREYPSYFREFGDLYRWWSAVSSPVSSPANCDQEADND